MIVSAEVNDLHAKRIELRPEDGKLNFKAPRGTLTDDTRGRTTSNNKSDIIAFLKEISATNQTRRDRLHEHRGLFNVLLQRSKSYFPEINPSEKGLRLNWWKTFGYQSFLE